MPTILEKIHPIFAWVERGNSRLGRLWLSHEDAEALKASTEKNGFDHVAQMATQEALSYQGCTFIGYLWGAEIYESEFVLNDHVAFAPASLEAYLRDSVGTVHISNFDTGPSSSG